MQTRRVTDYMSRLSNQDVVASIQHIHVDTPLSQAAAALARQSQAMVMDGEKPVGLFTRADALRAMCEAMTEAFGPEE
jgi:hypothetical protein